MKAEKDGQRSELTPLLIVNEGRTTGERAWHSLSGLVLAVVAWVITSIFQYHGEFKLTIAWIVVIIGLPLIFFLFPGRHKFSLYEEGVFIKYGLSKHLYRWDSFRRFTSDDVKKRFTLKMGIGSVLLTSREHFEEVGQILSEHIPPKQGKQSVHESLLGS